MQDLLSRPACDMYHGMEHSFTLTRGLRGFSQTALVEYLPIFSPCVPFLELSFKLGIKPSLSTDLTVDLCENTVIRSVLSGK